MPTHRNQRRGINAEIGLPQREQQRQPQLLGPRSKVAKPPQRRTVSQVSIIDGKHQPARCREVRPGPCGRPRQEQLPGRRRCLRQPTLHKLPDHAEREAGSNTAPRACNTSQPWAAACAHAASTSAVLPIPARPSMSRTPPAARSDATAASSSSRSSSATPHGRTGNYRTSTKSEPKKPAWRRIPPARETRLAGHQQPRPARRQSPSPVGGGPGRNASQRPDQTGRTPVARGPSPLGRPRLHALPLLEARLPARRRGGIGSGNRSIRPTHIGLMEMRTICGHIGPS
jgi:hypothetical protein